MKVRKVISGIMASALLFSSIPVYMSNIVPAVPMTAGAADDEEYITGTYETLTYNKYSDHIEISSCDKTAETIIIPDMIENLPVTGIENFAFGKYTNLTSITIPESVTSIGGGAFASCRNLTSIILPDSIASINDSTFLDCTNLTSITIPDGVTSIGHEAFSACTSLTSVTIPDSVTSIGNSAFHSCKLLTSITIPDSVTSIGHDAFRNCQSLTAVTIPDNITSISEYVFCNCTSLTSVTIPNSVTSIGGYSFLGCTSLTSITIPDSVSSIGYSTFRDCTDLTSVTIKNPDCEIYDSEYTINNGTICGYDNSTAQAYAEKYGYTFRILSEKTEYKTGDVNADDEIGIADLVLLSRHILAESALTAEQCERADLIRDNRIDVFDIIELKKLITQ
ncbi:MAG: leucine-rich repeat protein [Ruminococcus sp.]|nr:leucine-rich repeat protein [Ruminococcus sp.]